jgi:LacI family transcriptional regulator
MPNIDSFATVSADTDTLGRMAAQLLNLVLPRGSEIAIITTSRQFAGHQRVIAGFMKENERYGGLVVTAMAENYDNAEQSYQRAKELLDAHPGLKGIYVTSYNFLPVCRRLKECGRDDIMVVGHDLYPEMIAALTEGPLLAALYQNPSLHGQTAVRALYEAVTEKRKAGEILIKPEIVLRSNLDCYKGVY